MNGFILQILLGALVTLKLAFASALVGVAIGLTLVLCEFARFPWLRLCAKSFIFIVRGVPELLILFFIYFGITLIISNLFQHYVEISAFAAGVAALSVIFGANASQVFRGAFLAIDAGQIDAGRSLGFTRRQIFTHIQLPQAWRHAIPGLGNLWLVLLKDTAIVTLIGLTDLMNQAKIAASTTHEPFTYYCIAAIIYLLITYLSQQFIAYFSKRANRYVHP